MHWLDFCPTQLDSRKKFYSCYSRKFSSCQPRKKGDYRHRWPGSYVKRFFLHSCMKKQVLNVRYIFFWLDSARSRSGSTRLEAFFIQIKLNSAQEAPGSTQLNSRNCWLEPSLQDDFSLLPTVRYLFSKQETAWNFS